MFKETMDLKGKTVFITGASAGLGEQIAYEAAKKGAIVIVSARRMDLLLKVKRRCAYYSGREAYAFQMDVSNPDEIQRVIEEVHKTMGTIDVLVNNAGFGYFEEALRFDMSITENMFRVNVLGMMYVTQLVAIKMADQQKGHIINVASQAGKIATPKSAIYSASKFAVLGYSNALRLEVRPLNIFVTTVNPGPINTDFFETADETGLYLEKVGMFTLDAQEVAQKIVRVMGKPKRELNLPKMMNVAGKFYTVFPHLGDYFASTLFNNK